MTLIEWLKHIVIWFQMFPWPTEGSHAFVRTLGDPIETCWSCGRVQFDEEFDSEADQRMIDRYPAPDLGIES